MNMQKVAREIGFFETGINLSKVLASEDVRQKIGASMPFPDENIAGTVSMIAKWLHSFGKSKYMFLTPEIALIEEISKLENQEEVIIVIPCDLETEARERIRKNIPRNICVTTLEEPYFPQSFFPGNGIMVVTGYSASGRVMVLPDTYRLIEHYSGFLGKKVFVPYKEIETAAHYEGWIEISRHKISTIWRK